MSEDQKTNMELPPYTVTVPTAVLEKKRSTKKYVIIAVSGILTAIIILTAILVGIYLFYSAQKDLLKFTLNVDKNTKQDVSSDPNSNVVQYYVQNADYDLWVINDFNRDIQTLKVKDKTGTVCYVGPLNRTLSLSPSDINKRQSNNNNNNNSGNAETKENTVKYRTSPTTIPDISFLSKTASNSCKGVSTYWVYPYCETGTGLKEKRAICRRYIYWCCRTYYGRCVTICYRYYDYYC